MDQCAPDREALFKRTGSCLTKSEKDVLLRGSGYQKRQVLDVALKPKTPREWVANPRQWLNTMDINAVLTQYERKHKHFVYMGAHPRDFGLKGTHTSCVLGAPVQLCNFDVRRFLSGGYGDSIMEGGRLVRRRAAAAGTKRKWEMGVVFNLDARDEPGSHWVALYANFNPRQKKFGAYYFDSGANQPPWEHIGLFLDTLEREARAIPGLEGFRSHVNAIPVQRKNTECGVFASLFIIRCLEERDRTYEETIRGLGGDDEVWKFRKVLYRSPDAERDGNANAAYIQRTLTGGGGKQVVHMPATNKHGTATKTKPAKTRPARKLGTATKKTKIAPRK